MKQKVFTFAYITKKGQGYSSMIVSILQTDIEWASPKANMLHAERLLEQAEESELYVLPEMWSTGFATNPDGIADVNGEALEWMKKTAGQRNAAVCGSVAIQEADGTFRNRQYFVQPDGSFQFYDKRHLFSYGGEDKNYTRGEARSVAEYKGWRFLLLTCYDLRFPVWSRYRGDYDAIIYVANWPESRQRVWETLIRARAIENQCYVIGANRVGKDMECEYSGGSCIVDAKGKTVAESLTATEQTLTATLSRESQDGFRLKFQVLKDRD